MLRALIIDTPSILKTYCGENVALPACCKGYVQCRRYTPLAADGHPAFLLFNCYFFTGVNKEKVQSKLVEAMMTVGNSLDAIFAGDFNFIRRRDDSSNPEPSLASPQFLLAFDELCAYFKVSEVDHDEHTCFHYTKETDSKWSRSARLDRFYVPSRFASSLFAPCVSSSH